MRGSKSVAMIAVHDQSISAFVETEYVLCSTVAQENSAFARCCVLGFAAA